MPRYYFALEGDRPEPDGEQLSDDAAARRVAHQIAKELGRGFPNGPVLRFTGAVTISLR